ncbi:SIMPL domain-containing protein [Aggregatilinea lenta]|uniref:SIMPL domain-containing protein n=1 Tax=Aggregatilinea lenta TaxID=913108 RepID=UPI000E5B9701|nr:SIMPL domain-containing protein [Aggregatilinea lenta]
MRYPRTLKILAAVFAVALFAAFSPLAARTVSAQGDEQDRTLTVTGTGDASGTPNVAYITLGAEIRDADITAAVEQSNSVMDDVRAALADQGIPDEDMQTAQFNVNQDQPRDPQTGEITGDATYIVTNMLQVKVSDIAQISAVIQAALDAGANQVYGLNFGLDDPDALLSDARANAVADAQVRAEDLASAFGMTLGDVVRVTEGSQGSQPPQPYALQAQGLGGGGPTISPGELSVTVQVSVTFEITP